MEGTSEFESSALTPSRALRGSIVAAGAAGFLISLDTTVNIAFPAITAAFRLEVSQIQWVVISYVLTYASLLLATGRLSDVFGHRRVLLLGLALTALGVALCGLAPGFGWFLAARVVQGGGSALVLGSAPALVTIFAPEGSRSRALGGFQMGAALGIAIGPALGGALLEWTSWRSVYLIRIPIAAVVIALVVAVVPGRAAPGTIGPPLRGNAPLDLPGALSIGAGLTAGLLALSRVRDSGWVSPLVIVGLVGGIALLALWVRIERRSSNPVVDLSLLRDASFAIANALSLVANGTMFAIWLLAPYYLLNVRGLSTIRGGLVLGVAPMATAIASPFAGRLDGRISTGRLCTIGLVLEAAGLASVSAAGVHTPIAGLVIAFALVGFGIGLFTVPNLSYVMGSLSQSRQGVAGGLSQMMRTVGIVAGVSGASLFFDARHRHHIAQRALATDDPGAFVFAFRDTFLAVAVLCALAALVSLLRARKASGSQAVPRIADYPAS